MTLDQITSRWNALIAIAASIGACIGAFLLVPPVGEGGSAWSKFGVFAVALFIGLWLIPLQLYSSRKSVKVWSAIAILLVVSSVVGYFLYSSKLNEWTFEYAPGQVVVAGANRAKWALDFCEDGRRRGKTVTDKDLLFQAGGNFADVWPDPGDREHRTQVLLELYLAELLLLASAVVTVAQATYCASSTEVQKPVPAEGES
jgi:hypothetical protein